MNNMWNKIIVTMAKAAQIEGKCETIRSASTFGDLLFSTKDKGDRRRVSFGDLPFWLETAEGEVPCRSYIRRGALYGIVQCCMWYCMVFVDLIFHRGTADVTWSTSSQTMAMHGMVRQRKAWCCGTRQSKVWYGGTRQTKATPKMARII